MADLLDFDLVAALDAARRYLHGCHRATDPLAAAVAARELEEISGHEIQWRPGRSRAAREAAEAEKLQSIPNFCRRESDANEAGPFRCQAEGPREISSGTEATPSPDPANVHPDREGNVRVLKV